MVPDHIAARIAAAEDPLEESITLAVEQVTALRGVADGVHIMPLGADDAFLRITQEAGIG
jgi:5,10-methylenetetrahydrofolate reductase